MTYFETWAKLNDKGLGIMDPSNWGFADLCLWYVIHAYIAFALLRLIVQLSILGREWNKDRRHAKRYDALRSRARAAGRTIPEQQDFEGK